MAISYLISNENITVFLDNKASIISKTSSNFSSVIEAIKNNDEDSLRKAVAIENSIKKYTSEDLVIENNKVFYNGEELNGYEIRRLLEFIENDYPWQALANFIKKLQANPSMRSREQLYRFLESQQFTITDDGDVIGFKAVRADRYSINGNKKTRVIQGVVNDEGCILNNDGAIIEVDRRDVMDDPTVACSHGLHVGSLNFARSFNNNGIIKTVKFSPADAVSVPNDSEFQKLRVCKYQVISEFNHEESPSLGYIKFNDNEDDEDDDDWEDE